MSEPYEPQRSRRWLWGLSSILGLLALGLAVLGVITFVSFQVRDYRVQVDALQLAEPTIAVAITEPSPGAEFAAGLPLLTRIDVKSALALSAIELWANDEFVGLFDQLANESPNTIALIPWIPSSAGDYALIARAVGRAGSIADSNPVFIRVTPSDFLGSGVPEQNSPVYVGGGGEGAAPADLPPAILPPLSIASPSAEDSVAPAEAWQGSVGDWLGQLTTTAPPLAPALSEPVTGCDVLLQIHDLSDNEDGFFVYRQTQAIPQWKLLTTLDGQSQADFITYTDPGVPGPTSSYKVVAFNSHGDAASNPVSVPLNPADCPTQDYPALSVEFVDLLSTESVDELYCYTSFNGND